MRKKSQRLFMLLCGFFIANALLAEFIGVKIFSIENTINVDKINLNLFGYSLNLDMTAGVLLWPIVFIMTDIINEYFGKKGVKIISYFTVLLIIYSFIMIYLAMKVSPNEFFITSKIDQGIPNMNNAFNAIFGQGLWIIIGSLIAFLIGQFVDVYVFQKLKSITGNSKLWLRATGSTFVSQLIDSYVVLLIAFYIGSNWPLNMVLAIGTVNYLYKIFAALVLTPLLYLIHYLINSYLGNQEADKMIQLARKG